MTKIKKHKPSPIPPDQSDRKEELQGLEISINGKSFDLTYRINKDGTFTPVTLRENKF